MISREEFLNLYEKYLAGSCSEEEKTLLASYTDEISLSDDIWKDQCSSQDEIYNRIWKKLQQSRHWLTAAAVIFFTPSLNTLSQPQVISSGSNQIMLSRTVDQPE